MSVSSLETMMDGTAWAVVEKLERWDEKFDHVHSGKREHPRRKCRLVMTAKFADKNWQLVSGDVRIWVRNISRSGLAFVLAERIDTPHARIKIATAAGETEKPGLIVNRREVHDGFHEYGVKFAAPMPDGT